MKVKIKLNKANIRTLLQSEMMMNAVMNVAKTKGEVENSYVGFDRVQVVVKEEDQGD